MIRTTIEIEVDLLFVIPVLDYRHRSEEVWRNGAFERFDGVTVDNGRENVVHVEPAEGGLRLSKKGDPDKIVEARLLTWAVWCEGALTTGRLLNPLKGRTKEFSVSEPRVERIEIDGRSVAARRYDVAFRSPGSEELREGAVWYGEDGIVVKFTFPTKRGTRATLIREFAGAAEAEPS